MVSRSELLPGGPAERPELAVRIAERGWPEGIRTEDDLALDRLDADGLEALWRRLDAVLRWIEPGEGDACFRNANEAAVAAGLARTQFYQLLKDWKAHRSVASLGVVGKSGERRASRIDDLKAEISRTVAKTLKKEPHATTGSLLTEIAKRHPEAPSKTTLLRIIDAARRAAPPGPFGERVVFDSAGLDLADPEGHRLRLYASIDVGTGIILGWVAATERWGAVGYVHVADEAADRLHGIDLGNAETAPSEPAIEIRIGEDDAAGVRLFGNIGVAIAVPSGVDRLGRLLVSAIGDRVGPVWLGVGVRAAGISFRTGRAQRMPPMTSAMLDTIGATIAAANARRIDEAKKAGGGSCADDAIARVRRALLRIADLRSEIGDDR